MSVFLQLTQEITHGQPWEQPGKLMNDSLTFYQNYEITETFYICVIEHSSNIVIAYKYCSTFNILQLMFDQRHNRSIYFTYRSMINKSTLFRLLMLFQPEFLEADISGNLIGWTLEAQVAAHKTISLRITVTSRIVECKACWFGGFSFFI